MTKGTRRAASDVPGTSALRGRASRRGTEGFRDRHAGRFAEGFYRSFAGDLAASSIGVGTYLGDCDEFEDSRYLQAIIGAIRGGVNLVDTAINYRCQRAERVVGRAVRDAMHEGFGRDEIIICTKGGYVPLEGSPPRSRAEYQAYLDRVFISTGIVSPDEIVGGGHCLSPAYLRHQIAASRVNLGVETIDLYYLHNPEQQLATIPWDELRLRLREAFAVLEERVEAGDIGRYGCATWNGLRVPPGERDHLPLAEVVDIARDIAGERHHFAAVQLPLNLAMPEAMRVPTQRMPDGPVVAAVEAADALGLAVVVSAPLMQGRLTSGLPAAVAEAFPSLATDAQRALTFARTVPGVDAVLVGMKTAAHVVENLQSAARR